MAHFFVVVSGSKIHERAAHFFIDIYRMLREQKESGLSVKEWCLERGLAEHIYYYRLRKLRQAACTALEKAQPIQLAEVPLALTAWTACSQTPEYSGTLEIIENWTQIYLTEGEVGLEPKRKPGNPLSRYERRKN